MRSTPSEGDRKDGGPGGNGQGGLDEGHGDRDPPAGSPRRGLQLNPPRRTERRKGGDPRIRRMRKKTGLDPPERKLRREM